MSRYSVQKYIDKKFNDIFMDTNVMKAYNLGIAVGCFQAYKSCKLTYGKEKANEMYSNLDTDNEYSKILRTLIELDDKEALSTAEKIAEKLEECKKHDEKLSDEDRDFLEKLMEFLYRKEQNKEK